MLSLGAVAGLLLGGVATAALPNEKQPGFIVVRRSFLSGGEKILVDVYQPQSPGQHPPVLVLHGAGGMIFDGPEMTRVARALAAAGFTAYRVHYFDRTHTWFARQQVLLKLFPVWRATVHDAIAWVQTQQPRAGQAGVFGYSLGGFAALEEARRNPAIGAVVAHNAGFWHGHPEGPTRQPLPPILIVHGLQDRRVPNEKYVQPLIQFLRAHGDHFEERMYPSEGHDFSAVANADVRTQAANFFTHHLLPSRTTKDLSSRIGAAR